MQLTGKRMVDINLSRKCNGVGRHDQIIHFDNGEKRYIQGVVYIWENEMTHIVDYLGVEYIINKSKVLFVERVSYAKAEDSDRKGPNKARKAR
jgi:hypothetical protein